MVLLVCGYYCLAVTFANTQASRGGSVKYITLTQ